MSFDHRHAARGRRLLLLETGLYSSSRARLHKEVPSRPQLCATQPIRLKVIAGAAALFLHTLGNPSRHNHEVEVDMLGNIVQLQDVDPTLTPFDERQMGRRLAYSER